MNARLTSNTSRIGTGLVPFACTLLIACGERPELPEKIEQGNYAVLSEQVDWLARDAIKDGGAAVVGVYASGELVHFTGAGALPGGGLPSDKTRFRVGSISKLFTALAVLRLHEQGALDIDAPLADQLTGFSINSRFEEAGPITPRHVLSHHSGLPSDYMPGMFSDDPPRFTEMAGAMAEEHVIHAPGGWWSYSNVGFTLLGHLVEEVSGMRFEDYVAANIFEPCGMVSSSWDVTDSIDGTLRGEKSHEGTGQNCAPAGALVTTVADMGRFAQALLDGGACPDGEIVSAEMLEEAWSPSHHSDLDLELTWGLGFHVFEGPAFFGGERVVDHGGDTLLFHSLFLVAPELGLAVVASTNEGSAGEALVTAAREAMRLAIETETGERPAPLPELGEPAAANPYSGEELDDFVGTYGTMIGLLDVRRDITGIWTSVMGNDVQLVPTEEGSFVLQPKVIGVPLPITVGGIEVSFNKIGDEMIMGGRGGGFGPQWFPMGGRFEAASATGVWADRLGDWIPTNNDGDYLTLDKIRLADDGGYLVAIADMTDVNGTVAMAVGLLPLNDDHAITGGTGRRAGESVIFERTAEGEVMHLFGYTFERTSDADGFGCSAVPQGSASAWLLLGLVGLGFARSRRS